MKFDFGKIFLSKGVNYFTEDLPLQKMLSYLDVKTDKDMVEMGKYVSERMIEVATFVDHFAKPTLRTWGILDDRVDGVWLSSDHYEVLQKLQQLGAVRKSIQSGNLMYHFLSGYVISDSGIFCTLTLTAQTAYGLAKYGKTNREKEFLQHFLDPAEPWFGATYYSEIQGGSDLGSNRTTAAKVDDGWLLNGNDKYFASNAGVADGAITTARIKGDPEGAKGISVFFVPAIRRDGTPNYRIRRIKDKLGTISVPTGEVELENSEGYLLGDEGKGIYYAMEILTVSRIDDAIAAAGIARKALWEAYLYANARTAFGKTIIDHPLLARDFLEMEADLEAAVLISLVAAMEFSRTQESRPPYNNDYHFARMMSHIAKNVASTYGSRVTQYCLEVVGGKGFMSEFPLEKFHRDELVTSIWEGTSNIQAVDLLEILKKKATHRALFDRIESVIDTMSTGDHIAALKNAVKEAADSIDSMLSSPVPELLGKDILLKIGEIAAAVYLFDIGEKQKSPEISAIARIYFDRHFTRNPFSPDFLKDSGHLSWMRKSE